MSIRQLLRRCVHLILPLILVGAAVGGVWFWWQLAKLVFRL